jgi:hypothetical protein
MADVKQANEEPSPPIPLSQGQGEVTQMSRMSCSDKLTMEAITCKGVYTSERSLVSEYQSLQNIH